MKKFEYLWKLPNYDDFTRYCNGSMKLDEDQIEIKKFLWRHCDHLFALVEGNNHIECVKCGLTNRFTDFEKHSNDERNLLYYGLKFNDITYETEEFYNQYPNFDSLLNLNENQILSENKIITNHPNILFSIAYYFSKTKTKKEIFQIMNVLNNLETSLEKRKIFDLISASSLIERYKDKLIEKQNRIEYFKTKKKIYLVQ